MLSLELRTRFDNALANPTTLDDWLAVADIVIQLISPNANLDDHEDIKENVIDISLQQNGKAEGWYKPHPFMGGERVALQHFYSDGSLVESKFYWLGEKAFKRYIAGSVQLTPNWEDSELTRKPSYKVGVDFFVTSGGDSLLVALSNRGNLRIVELKDKLSKTQADIFEKIIGAGELSSQEAIHATLWDAFALKEVNKAFYNGLAEHFNDLLQALVASGRDTEDSKLFASRLLGRLLFVWFLRKKDIISPQAGYFDIDGLSSSEYYETKLKKLFFSVLNKPQDERKQGDDTKTPYLNGGLFEAHNNDWPHSAVVFPTGFFSRLFEHFDQFNFTTDESSPEYEQVAIDPEMLGRVFESLLASQLTATGEQARKAKGAFYTPREIVGYMCRASLRQYLYTKLGDETLNQGVDDLLDKSDSQVAQSHSNFKRDLWGEATSKEVVPRVVAALDSLTLLDPACGSGAFPMGMLQLLHKTYERLDNRFDSYKTKLQIVRYNIYGVDIEPMAVEIARLRAWLSLIVDEDSSRPVEPLPNLDFKFVCANSLLPLARDTQQSLLGDNQLHQKLKDLRTQYFNARKPHTKQAIKDAYYKLAPNSQLSLQVDDERTRQLKSFDPFTNAHPAEFFDPDQMFGIDTGFDIVIGNPPYVGEKGHKEIFKPIAASGFGKRFYMGKMDLFYFFFHLSLDVLKDGGTIAFITTNYYITATGGKKLRADMQERSTILELLNFGELKIFESAVGQHNMITLLQKGSGNAIAHTANVSRKGHATADSLNSITSGKDIETTYANIENSKLFSSGNIVMRSSPLEDTLDKIKDNSRSLSEICSINQGVLSGADTLTAKHLEKYGTLGDKGDGIFVLDLKNTRDLEVYNSIPENERDILKPFYKNSDISKYIVNGNNTKFLIYVTKKTRIENYPFILEHLSKFRVILSDRLISYNEKYEWYCLHRERNQEIFEVDKIVLPYRSTSNVFALVDFSWYFRTDSYSLTLAGDFPLKLLLGILNSRLVYRWLYSKGKRKGEILELFSEPLSEIPIPYVSAANQLIADELVAIVDQIIIAKQAEKDTDTSNLESQVDHLVYQLYNLSDEEINLVESTE